jgi:hypothetical protein
MTIQWSLIAFIGMHLVCANIFVLCYAQKLVAGRAVVYGRAVESLAKGSAVMRSRLVKSPMKQIKGSQ